mmetsp:Transcript_66000/g.213538  ORF Transcript_66000/g.213538 Transcript_66000/m.213538 type:complete len:81 (-) Transcript_66000:95-337(-)
MFWVQPRETRAICSVARRLATDRLVCQVAARDSSETNVPKCQKDARIFMSELLRKTFVKLALTLVENSAARNVPISRPTS